MPVRIQRKRTKGWRMPPNTIYVGRPTKWGNPFKPTGPDYTVAVVDALEKYKAYLAQKPNLITAARRELCGKDLGCWCRLDQPCHADILLKIANAGGEAA